MREGLNPLADRIALLTQKINIPKSVRVPIEQEDLSTALKAANQWYAKSRSAAAAVTYASVLMYRGLDDEAFGVVSNAREEEVDASLELLWIEACLLTGRVDEALEQLKTSPDLDAGQETFLAEILLDLEQNEHAEQRLLSAIEKGGTLTAARTLFTIFSGRGEVERAAETIAMAGRFAPDDQVLWLAIAQAWELAHRFEQASRAYERVLKIGGDFYQLAPNYIDALIAHGDYDNARRAVVKMREYDDEDVHLMRAEASILWHLGRSEEARVRLEEMIALGLADAEDVVLLSMCAQRIGDVGQQERVLREGMMLDPSVVAPALVRCLLTQGRTSDAREALSGLNGDEVDLASALIDIHDGSPLGFEPAEIEGRLELMETALACRRLDLFSVLAVELVDAAYQPWIDLMRFWSALAAGGDAIWGDYEDVPFWETTVLAELAERLDEPAQSRFWEAMQSLEERMLAG